MGDQLRRDYSLNYQKILYGRESTFQQGLKDYCDLFMATRRLGISCKENNMSNSQTVDGMYVGRVGSSIWLRYSSEKASETEKMVFSSIKRLWTKNKLSFYKKIRNYYMLWVEQRQWGNIHFPYDDQSKSSQRGWELFYELGCISSHFGDIERPQWKMDLKGCIH